MIIFVFGDEKSLKLIFIKRRLVIVKIRFVLLLKSEKIKRLMVVRIMLVVVSFCGFIFLDVLLEINEVIICESGWIIKIELVSWEGRVFISWRYSDRR